MKTVFWVAFTALTFSATPSHADEKRAPTMVSLDTGSRVASWTIAPPKPVRKVPIVFLHGGPGLYTEARRLDEGAAFRAAGFTTIYFDQAGGGKSDRLPAREYTLDRAVADIEALRIKLGQDRMILWGNSYGASLAAVYATRFPSRVAGVILTSPGTYPGTRPTRNYGLTNRDKVSWGRAFSQALSDIDKSGAGAEIRISQTDAGLAFDQVVASELLEGMVCKGAKLSPPPIDGGGNLYANRMILKEVEKLGFNPAPLPRIPTLIARGACDFLPDSNAMLFAKLFGTTVTTIPATGHGFLENRSAVDSVFAAFANGPLAQTDR